MIRRRLARFALSILSTFARGRFKPRLSLLMDRLLAVSEGDSWPR